MTDFSITLDGKEYKVTSSVSDKNGNNWQVSVLHGKVRSNITIPIEERVTRAKVILFIEAFHVAMHVAFDAQKIDQSYTWNVKSNLV